MKMNGCKVVFVVLVSLCASLSVAAQTISGKVTDEKGLPVPGAAVMEKGTGKGVLTDIDGKYSISAGKNVELEAVCLGYETQSQKVSGRAVVDFVLKEESQVLDDVVVVGYGTQKKVNVTGAISSVGEDVLKDRGATSNVISSLQGTMPGVIVTKSTPAVGREGWGIKIRGEASVNSTDALVLVDGSPGSLEDLNPQDIENISVLKDASAAIYGARSAGGVILVTTKRGTSGKPRISYDGNFEVKIPSLQVQYLNASEYAYIFEEGVINDNSVAFFQGTRDKYGKIETGINTGSVYKTTLTYGLIQEMKKGSASQYTNTVQPYQFGGFDIGFFDYDINKVLWKPSFSHSHNISVKGGNDNERYNLSIGYMRDNSMLKVYDEFSDRFNFRFNNDFKIAKWLSLASNVAFDRRHNDYATYSANAVNGLVVGSPMETRSGKPYSWGSQVSGYGLAKWGGSTNTYNNRATISLEPKFTICRGLRLIGKAAVVLESFRKDITENQVQWFRYDDTPSNSGKVFNPAENKVSKNSVSRLRQEYQAYADYSETFKDAHKFQAMLGVSYESYRVDSFTANGDVLSTDAIHSLNTATLSSVEDTISDYALASYFGRVNYNYRERYLIELLGRFDGSSRFARGHRWAPFYGCSVGWRLSEEEFMKKNGVFDNLKFRVSYGETGNQSGIGYYDYYSTIQQNSQTAPLIGQGYSSNLIYSNMVSLDRTWERISNFNAGLDFATLSGRLGGTVEFFRRVNNDMLVSVTYPQVLGATAPKSNSGRLEVNGWEVSLFWNDKIGDFRYHISMNVSDSRNKLARMEGKQVKTWNGITNTLEGYPLGTIWGLDAIKLIETPEELAAYIPTVGDDVYGAAETLQCGDVMYRDLDGDNEITQKDVKLLGDTTPHYSYAFNLGIEYKSFEFSCMFQGVGEQTILRGVNSTTCLGYSWYQASSNAYYSNHWTTVREACQAVGDMRSTLPVNRDPDAAPRIGYLVGKNYNYLASSAWWSVQNGAYLRLKNVSLSYTLDKKYSKKIGIKKLRFFVAGNDLLTFCSIKDGYDPENTSNSNGGAKVYTGYPFSKSVIAGINLTF